jgi:hypothetical protein
MLKIHAAGAVGAVLLLVAPAEALGLFHMSTAIAASASLAGLVIVAVTVSWLRRTQTQ